MYGIVKESYKFVEKGQVVEVGENSSANKILEYQFNNKRLCDVRSYDGEKFFTLVEDAPQIQLIIPEEFKGGRKFNIVDKAGEPSPFNPYHFEDTILIDKDGDESDGVMTELLAGHFLIERYMMTKEEEIELEIDNLTLECGKKISELMDELDSINGRYIGR